MDILLQAINIQPELLSDSDYKFSAPLSADKILPSLTFPWETDPQSTSNKPYHLQGDRTLYDADALHARRYFGNGWWRDI